ncbi:MAG: hypothetical protein OXH51_14280 [Gemmatimonadetes bacterium]|nr:hypothetical protein [Gemmatimonadota bacterium]
MSSDLPAPVRRYGDKEVRQLLQRAAELQKQESVREYGDDAGGLTLADLQEVAAEAGIHPRYIQQAAAGIERSRPSGLAARLAGTELTITVERVVPGELPGEGFEQAIMEIQRAFSGSGNPSMVGRTLMWKSDTMDHQSSLQVTVSSRRGETRIRAEERLHGTAAAAHLGLVVGAGMGVGLGVGISVGLAVLGSALFATLFPVGAIGGIYAAVRRWMKKLGVKRRRELELMADRIAAYARTDAIEPASSAQAPLGPGPAELPG